MGGMILFVLAISWVFGREFTDGTLKDLLAVPVPRVSILLAKFIVVALWSAALAVLLFGLGLGLGALFHLPGGSTAILLQGCARAAITAGLVIAAMLPFAFFASLGRGYLLPIGVCFIGADPGERGHGGRLGGIFPLVDPGHVCAGQRGPAAGQFRDRAADRAGWAGRDVCVVEVRRPE